MTNLLRKRGQKGFTLVELMVVLLIIGILVAIAIPLYNRTQDNAKTTSCKANLRTLNGAYSQYLANNPGSNPSLDNLVNEGYLKAKPHCPADPTNKDYTFSNGFAVCPVYSTHKDHTL